MTNLIPLVCGHCGGKLNVEENSKMHRCEYCGVYHYLERQEDRRILCPVCNENDQVRKAAIVYNEMKGSGNIPKAVIPPQHPKTPTLQKSSSTATLVSGIVIFYVSNSYFKGLIGYLRSTLDYEYYFWPSLSIYLLICSLLITIFIKGSRSYKTIKNENEILMREFNASKSQNKKKLKHWNQYLYYCARDGISFDYNFEEETS